MSIPGAAVHNTLHAHLTAVNACFHCGEAVPAGARFDVEVDGEPRPMCCRGCAAAATAIRAFGLGGFYRQRETRSPRPDPDAGAEAAVYDDPALQARFVRREGAHAETLLSIEGMSCAACAWLIESRVGVVPGVDVCEVDFSRRRARLRWNTDDAALSGLLGAVNELGFRARPFTPEASREHAAAEAEALFRRAALAALFGAQVMMIALGLYLAGPGDMEAGLRTFLRWTSLVLTLPVVGYCAVPLLASARRALAAGTVNMDVPVSLAIGLAFTGSVYHVLLGAGEIYFDSVVMFTALLLLARTLEVRARVRAAAPLDGFAALVPDAARVLRPGGQDGHDGHWDTVPVVRLAPGDSVRVLAGERLPADGTLTEGESTVDESILTGETLARTIGPGARVLAGSVNVTGPVTVRVTSVGEEAFAGQLATLVARAAATRPQAAELGISIARWFVIGVLAVSAVAAVTWSVLDPARAFAITLAVLVVSCPCALALAVPAALTTAYGALLARGIAVVDPGALERLARAGAVWFDKTGTLTLGRLAVTGIDLRPGFTREQVLSCARALARESRHPVSQAIVALDEGPPATAADVRETPGRGLAGRVGARRVVLGSRAFVAEACGSEPGEAGDAHKEAWLAIDGRPAARLTFDDPLRPECEALFAWLHGAGYRTAVLSGDRPATVQRVAALCGAERSEGGLLPADKVERVARAQRGGACIVMIGDGLNDAPVLARADVSVAVADAVALSRQQAGVLLLDPDLGGLRTLLALSRSTRRVVRQNFAWALGYNALALPLALSGVLPPWGAALGMSLSSLAVVVNALRLQRAAR